jgi:hypothetical protein
MDSTVDGDGCGLADESDIQMLKFYSLKASSLRYCHNRLFEYTTEDMNGDGKTSFLLFIMTAPQKQARLRCTISTPTGRLRRYGAALNGNGKAVEANPES